MKTRTRLLIVLALFTGLHHTVAQSNFALAIPYIVDTNPVSVVAADINGDGKLDLISANLNADTLSILTNDGSGNFAFASTVSAGHRPRSVAAVDVNGDGKLDLICASDLDNTLSVLTNNGGGGFVLSSSPAVNFPYSVVATDVNGDGKLDLVAANILAKTLSVLTNNGNGGFGSNTTLNVGNGPNSVASADVNGDGKVDLICANRIDGTLLVLTNNGNGDFGSNATYIVGSEPYSVGAADINGDGKVDLISANSFDNTLSVLTNNGSGIFGSNATLNVGNEPECVVVADINGDDKMDLICANSGGYPNPGTLSVLTNNGSGGFALATSPNVGVGADSVAAADVNGDGKVDLISVNYNDDTLSVLLNTSIFSPPTFIPSLTIGSSGNNVFVSWPSAAAGWSLQQNPDLTMTHWGPSGYNGYTISDDGTNKSFTILSPTGNLFFRLLHP